jgi:thioesterase domain-containing protein
MTENELELHLHREIPLSAAMGVRVLEASGAQVRLGAPLAPNINHMQSLFGGSAVAVATLSAWVLLTVKLQQAGVRARLLIQRSSMHYEHPIETDFEALCTYEDEPGWQRFMKTLERHGRARTRIAAALLMGQQRMASFQGDYVALAL